MKSLVVDPFSTQIVAAVAEAGSRPGYAGGHVAVPLGGLRLGQGRRLVIDLTREQFYGVPKAIPTAAVLPRAGFPSGLRRDSLAGGGSRRVR